MNATKSFTALPDQSAFFASLLAEDPDLAAYVTAAYGKGGTALPSVKVTRTVDFKGIKPAKGKSDRKTGPGSRGGKVKEKTEKPEPRPIVALTLRRSGPGAAHFLSALLMAGKRIRCYEADYTDPVTGETFAVGDPKIGMNGDPITFFAGAAEARTDEWAAIEACFSGSDRSEALGTQLDQARLLAHTELRRIQAGTVVRRPFHYTGIDNLPRTVINVISHPGVIPAEHAWRSPEGHTAKWSLDGYVKGLPRPIQKLLSDLHARERLATTEMVNLGKLRQFVVEGDRDGYEKLISEEYPPTSAAEPIYAVDGITVASYTIVAKDHPVVAAVKREHGASLIVRLAKLEAFAAARLAEIQKDIDGLADEPDADTVGRVYAVMLDRGSLPTLEESVMTCYDHGSRSYYTLPVGTVIDARPIEALAAKREETALYLTK